jgi:hypothetical protein
MQNNKNGAKSALMPLATLVLACLAAPALAVDLDSFELGAFKVTPDFNTRVTPSGSTWLANGEEQTAELLTFKPKITALASLDGRELSSTLEVQNGNYSAGRLDNFLDWRFENALGMQLGPQGRVRLRTELFDSHESGTDAFSPAAPAQHFFSSSVNTSYEHTAWGGRAKMLVDAGTSGKDYVDSATSTSLRDHDLNQIGTEFRLRVLPGADMLLKYQKRDIKYLTTPSLSSLPRGRSEVLSYVGGSWEGQVGIAGDWRIASGYRQTTVSALQPEPGTAAWETRVRWQPLDAGTVTFDADRSFGGNFGNRPDVSSYRYNVEYRWAPVLKTTLAGTWSSKSWNSSALVEEGMGVKMRMDYAWSSWVDMFVSIGHEQRWSPQNKSSFSQQSLMLGVAASLDRLFGR